MNRTIRRILFPAVAVILLLSACGGPMPAATQESPLVQQLVEQSVELTMAVSTAQAREQEVLELSQALTAAAEQESQAVLTPTTAPETVGTLPDITDLATSTAEVLPPTPAVAGTLDPNAPSVESVSPNSGFLEGGATVTITGTNFATGIDNTRFLFGEFEATGVICLSSTRCTAVVPFGGTQGNVVVRAEIRGEHVSDADSDPGTFTYIVLAPNEPLITSILPQKGPVRGGTKVTIRGKHFLGALDSEVAGETEFFFGEAVGKDAVCISSEECEVTSPPGVEGFVIVSAVNTLENGNEVRSRHIEDNDRDGFKYEGTPKYGCGVYTAAPGQGRATLEPGEDFTIRWIIVNTGENSWPPGFDVKYSAGVQLSGVTRVEIPVALGPNDQYEVKINATAPDSPGTYYMGWLVEGMGCNASVVIDVVEE